jgi:hypothetical protein
MRNIFKNTLCLLILATVVHLIYQMTKSQPIKPLEMKKQKIIETRFQQNQPVVDRLPLVEENSTIIPANEIIQMNYKDCNSQLDKELYTNDSPLFAPGSTNLVPLDVNDSAHRRINFY